MHEITEGIHPNIPNDVYHAETGWWSSTQLKGLLPEHYKPVTGESDAMRFGTLAHTAVLEPDLLDAYVTLDAAKVGLKADGTPAANPYMTGAWKKAAAEVEASGGIPVALADMELALRMRDAVAAHPTAAALLMSTDGVSEESVFTVDDDAVKHKARFDRRIPGAIVDLKTTSSKPGAAALGRAVLDYGYDLSAAHYLEVAALTGLDAGAFAWVFVDKTPDGPRVTVAEPDAALLERGRVLRARALARAAGTLPAYEGATGYLTLTCPPWAQPHEEMEGAIS